MAHDLVTELPQYSSLACFMPIWQLCANLLIPNCLRSNLSYSPLAALVLYVKTDNSFFYDLIHSHAQTKLKGDVWGYIKALNSIHMEYIGTKTDYIYHGSSLAPSYTPVTRNLYKGVNNNGVIFKSLQINGQIYKNNSGNTYTNP